MEGPSPWIFNTNSISTYDENCDIRQEISPVRGVNSFDVLRYDFVDVFVGSVRRLW